MQNIRNKISEIGNISQYHHDGFNQLVGIVLKHSFDINTTKIIRNTIRTNINEYAIINTTIPISQNICHTINISTQIKK